MADEKTQEQVREAKERLTDWSVEMPVGDKFPQLAADLRTLLAAYTRMEADMAEARKLMEPFVKEAAKVPEWVDGRVGADTRLVRVKDFRALAAFYNKGEE